MGLTDRHQLPFPEDADPPDIPSDLYELALRIDAVLTAMQIEAAARVAELSERFAELERRLIDIEAERFVPSVE